MTIPSTPTFGGSSFPVRDRPPSMKNSTGTSIRISSRKYRSNTTGKMRSSVKLRRMKNAPHRRKMAPSGQNERLSPATMWGITMS